MKKYILILALVCFVSCGDFLDIRPSDKIIPKSADDYSTLLNNVLNEIENGQQSAVFDNYIQVSNNEEVMDDLDANIYLETNSLWIYLGSFLSGRTSDYESIYKRIMQCNIIIGNMSDDDSELAKKLTSVAYAIRAVCHYNVLRQFCEPMVNGTYPELGIVCVDEFNIEAKLPRSSYQRSVELIERDFIKALEYNMTDAKFMFTPDVVNAFMARFYFWTQQWDKALSKAEGVLVKYPLQSGEAYKQMFLSRVPRGSVIFKSHHFSETGNDYSEASTMKQLQTRPINKTLIDLFDQPDKDIRYSMITNSKRIVQKRPFPCLRSDEMALIIAECHYHLNAPAKALAAINELRRHRIEGYTDLQMSDLPAVSNSNIIRVDANGNALTPLLSIILGERRKELFMEGDRLFERKRNGRPETWVPFNGRIYTNYKFMYTFPIPYADTKLVEGVIQNPGYRTVN